MEATLENERERYKDKYGDNWKYKVRIVDSYGVDFSDVENYVDVSDSMASHFREVVVSVQHKGSGWFNDKEGSEDITVTLVKHGRKWYVLYFE